MINHLQGAVHIAKNNDVLFTDLADRLTQAAIDAVEARGEFHLALSGGQTPAPFYQLLVIDPNYRKFPWDKTHLWVVDERCVGEDDERYNFKMIKAIILDHVPILKAHSHPMPVLQEHGAQQYQEEMIASVPDQKLDFIVLGMGGDTHTASLFPGSPAINETEKLVANNQGPAVTPPNRLTMTYPLINQARQIAILAVGAAKHTALVRVSDQLETGSPDIQNVPISGIKPSQETCVTWFLDRLAAGQDL